MELLTLGARGQGSEAPLDYLLIKAMDQVYQKAFPYIPKNVYYRLNSIFWSFTAGLSVAFLFFFFFYRKTDNNVIFAMQLALICMALSAFYYKNDNMHFSIEMRPYALWNSLWYVMLAFFMLWGARIRILLVGAFWAWTSSGALIQVPALVLSWFVLQIIDRKRPVLALREMVFVFGVPFLIAVFYAIHIKDNFEYIRSAADYKVHRDLFSSFWTSKWDVPLISGVAILLTAWNRQWRWCPRFFI